MVITANNQELRKADQSLLPIVHDLAIYLTYISKGMTIIPMLFDMVCFLDCTVEVGGQQVVKTSANRTLSRLHTGLTCRCPMSKYSSPVAIPDE